MRNKIERLIGGPIELEKPSGPIPCHETSDAERLCRHPLVSVHMVTFNHAPYIREAVESVVMQEVDFEYELVIGEDCSTDRTREICFELQRKYPEKIRVLWGEENLYKNWGNYQRVYDHCRGEYIAYCEGDDYWTDPKKLQKQVDLMRREGAGLCVAFHWNRYDNGRMEESIYQTSRQKRFDERDLAVHWFHTSTYVISRVVFQTICRKYPRIHPWYDLVLLPIVAGETKVCLLPEIVSVYRRTGEGICTSLSKTKQRLLSLRQVAQVYFDGPSGQRRKLAVRGCRQVVGLLACATEQSACLFLKENMSLIRSVFWGFFWRFFWLPRMVLELGLYVKYMLRARRSIRKTEVIVACVAVVYLPLLGCVIF